MKYGISHKFEDFWYVISRSDYQPPIEAVRKGLHIAVTINDVPVGCGRLIPYPNKNGQVNDYALGNIYLLDLFRRGNRHGIDMFRVGFNKWVSDLGKDVSVFGTVGKDRYGQILKRYYAIFGGREVTDSYREYLKTELGFEPASDQILLSLDLENARVTEELDKG